jgi:hypothetical protein
LAYPSTPSFCLFLVHFLTTFCICLNISHPTIPHLSQCQCGHTINDLGIHLLCCLCESEHTTTHDTFQNIVVVITSQNGAHVKKEVSHFFSCPTQKQMDIVIARYKLWTLVNIIIVDLTHTNLVQWASTTTTHATIIIAQDKAQSYIEWAPRNDFIPLAIETYGCFHPHFDSFLSSCVHANITCHQQTSLVPSMFIYYYKQQVSITFQRAQ